MRSPPKAETKADFPQAAAAVASSASPPAVPMHSSSVTSPPYLESPSFETLPHFTQPIEPPTQFQSNSGNSASADAHNSGNNSPLLRKVQPPSELLSSGQSYSVSVAAPTLGHRPPYSATTAALLTNFLLNNSSLLASGRATSENGFTGQLGANQPFLDYTLPRGQARSKARRRHELQLRQEHLNGTSPAGCGSPSHLEMLPRPSEPLAFDYSRAVMHSVACSPYGLPPQHTTLSGSSNHTLPPPLYPPSSSPYATDSSLPTSLYSSDHFCPAGLTDSEENLLLSEGGGGPHCTGSLYPSSNHYPSTYPGSYCAGSGPYCPQAYYAPPPPPPPPTVISEHGPGASSSPLTAGSRANSLLYLQQQQQQSHSHHTRAPSTSYHISTQPNGSSPLPPTHHHAYSTSASASQSPPALPPPPLSYHLPPTNPGNPSCPYPDYHLDLHHPTTQQQYPAHSQMNHLPPSHPSPANMLTLYNQSTGQTRSYCPEQGCPGPGPGPKGGGPLGHHHHHHHLYHYHLPPDQSKCSNSGSPSGKGSPKAPLYAQLNPATSRIDSMLVNGVPPGMHNPNNPNPNVAYSQAKTRVLNGGLNTVYYGQTAASQVGSESAYPRHLNGNCVANHETDSRMTQPGSAQGTAVGCGTSSNAGGQTAVSSGLETRLSQRDMNSSSSAAGAGGGASLHYSAQSSAAAAAAAVAAEMASQKAAADQEAQLRELKGYEASYQYQPRSVLYDGPGGAKYIGGAGGPNDGPSNGPPMLNTNAIPGSDKRSCSQWRMTLFVFYWIIWIVFLIGVVIIVAAGARTP